MLITIFNGVSRCVGVIQTITRLKFFFSTFAEERYGDVFLKFVTKRFYFLFKELFRELTFSIV